MEARVKGDRARAQLPKGGRVPAKLRVPVCKPLHPALYDKDPSNFIFFFFFFFFSQDGKERERERVCDNMRCRARPERECD